MKCNVNGNQVSSSLFACREMNFGQPVGRRSLLVYSVSISFQEFSTLIQETYEKFIREEKADEPYHADDVGKWPLLDELKRAGYPSIGDLLLTQPDIMSFLIKEWLTVEVLDRLFPLSPDDLQFIINTVEAAEITNDSITIWGYAIQSGENR
jgi:hypothetical protein